MREESATPGARCSRGGGFRHLRDQSSRGKNAEASQFPGRPRILAMTCDGMKFDTSFGKGRCNYPGISWPKKATKASDVVADAILLPILEYVSYWPARSLQPPQH